MSLSQTRFSFLFFNSVPQWASCRCLYGIVAVSWRETGCLVYFQNLSSSIQVLRFKDVPFLASAAQDGPLPTLWARPEREKAVFVYFLKAPQCSYLILFQINISGNFRWLSCVKGTLYPSTVLLCRAPWEAVKICKLCCLSVLSGVISFFSLPQEI